MSESSPGFFRRLFRRLWRFIDVSRRITLNLVFVALVALLVAALVERGGARIEDGSALVIAPSGSLVEQKVPGDPSLLLALNSDRQSQPVLRDILDAIHAAKTDSRIRALVLDPTNLDNSSLSKIEEIHAAVQDFRRSGKRVYAYGENLGQGQYLFASAADRVFLHPFGAILLSGFSRYPTYYKGLLDKLGVRMQVFRVGTYKSAVEPYLRNDMSDADREAAKAYLGAAWQNYLGDVAKARRLGLDDIRRYAEEAPTLLRAAGGNAARAAQTARLVDGLKTRDQFDFLIKSVVGVAANGKDAKLASLDDYLSDLRGKVQLDKDQVGVVVVQGTIVDGQGSSGNAGGEAISALLRQVREDKAIKALVLRVDSPGGSAWASEQMRRELELTRAAGKPVIVSMSSVAASGGYWIAMAGDEVWAHPSTITGSIGIFGLLPDLSGPLNKAGLGVDGVGTTPLAGAPDLRRPLPPQAADLFQQSIEEGYRRFLGIVSHARRMSPEQVDGIGQGRVWIGSLAREKGLVDHLGGFDAAIASAASKAHLDHYRVNFITKPLSARERLFSSLQSLAPESHQASVFEQGAVAGMMRELNDAATSLSRWQDPGNAYVHCLCAAP